MYLSPEIAVKLNYFRTSTGQAALATLCEVMYSNYIKELINQEGAEVHRAQGKIQLIEWLKSLPKGLNDAANGSDPEQLG